ncbi:LuxR C-terminal-related transcriptional regulator [Yokenella regensburgei]|uniref:helix-turn-helix domain-containing protein n=1 Tax=Yokenella regensburgei TaxID=158877 RepID=UPI0027D93816|nr:LuxR C-terminal-related transcriptional regulator [Yokenella regensburgei]MDQ4429061.1 LuxR C-terminal-related transcriptional regulator [Yokenella regensburgei]
MKNKYPAEAGGYPAYQIFLYCSCQYTALGFSSLFKGMSPLIEITHIEYPRNICDLLDKSKKQLLVVSTHDDSLYFSAQSAWFELSLEENVHTKEVVRVHMFSEGNFSRKNSYHDFSLNESTEQVRKHIIMLLTNSLFTKRHVNPSMALTFREKELINYISLGLSVRDIAKKMGVCERTILVFRMTIIKKMGFRNRNHIHRLNFRCEERFKNSDFTEMQN